ncbi:MAG TPA: haloalkane dehalogenase [Microscillaceae bacterium]|nr:haloalkane dehalogenase [Microscillaceae bacterium]
MVRNISPNFPYESKYLNIFGSDMHYVEEYADASNPDQLTFLFIHGNPTSSYLWRNIIPYVEGLGRAIAPDLIGMGKSDKPAINYTFQDHFRYLNEFIQQKNLKNIVLVIHDWGSALGFLYAAQNEENIVGIAFMEAVTKALSWKDASFLERILFRRFRNEKKGHKMIAVNNFFIKQFLFKLGTKRKLTEEEKAHYAAPYPTIESRKPIRVWPKEIPFDGPSQSNWASINGYAQWLEKTTVPKLLLYAKPGMILKKKEVERIKKSYKKLEAVYVGKGKHYIQEDVPHEIGSAIKSWAQKLRISPVAPTIMNIN